MRGIVKKLGVERFIKESYLEYVMDTFYRDLKRGKAIEKAVLNIVMNTYPDAKIIDGYCKEWDIFIPSKNFGVEVKYDLKSKYT